ncbi:MAG: hypothetical protein NZ931_05980 [Aigarchaeota archaeon]|nr:hypothetical protein [Aigarchaeota archaeon]
MLKPSFDFEEFMGQKIYDLAVEAGTALVRADKTTISQLIEVFQSEDNAVSACPLLILHVIRQSSRDELPKHGANILVRHLSYIYQKLKDDREKIGQAIFKYLTLVKWIYESRPSKQFNTFQEFVESIR